MPWDLAKLPYDDVTMLYRANLKAFAISHFQSWATAGMNIFYERLKNARSLSSLCS